MKKNIALLAVQIFLMLPQMVQAEEPFYVGLQGGVNFLESHYLTKRHCAFDAGYNAGIVGGYAWCPELRLESEITYRNNDYRLRGTRDGGDEGTFHGVVDTWSFMANGYLDVPVCVYDIIAPYVGVGIGCDHVHQKIKIDGENYKGSNTGFSWQLIGGASFCLFDDTSLLVEYKYHVTPLRRGHELQNHSVIFGIRKSFCCCF